MIARDSKNPDKGAIVPRLDLSSLYPEEKTKAEARRQQAIKNVKHRKEQMQNSYDVRPPSPEETQRIHDIFLKRKQEKMLEMSTSAAIS